MRADAQSYAERNGWNAHVAKRSGCLSEMHLRQDAPATKSSGYPRPQAEPRRGRKRLRRQVPRRASRGALRSKVARGCANPAGAAKGRAEHTIAESAGVRSGRPRRQSRDCREMRRRSSASEESRAGEAERTSEAKWPQGAAVVHENQRRFPDWAHGWDGTAHVLTSTQDGTVKQKEQEKKLSIYTFSLHTISHLSRSHKGSSSSIFPTIHFCSARGGRGINAP